MADGVTEVTFVSDFNDAGLSSPMRTRGVAFEIPTGTVMAFTGSSLTFEATEVLHGNLLAPRENTPTIFLSLSTFLSSYSGCASCRLRGGGFIFNLLSMLCVHDD